jgi:hypothetical protein
MKRRAFLAAGALGVAALAAGGWLRYGLRHAPPGHALDDDATAIVTALVPAFLDGALPDDPAERGTAIGETVAAVDKAITGLPPLSQRELAQLFGLLAFPPARVALGVRTAWREAPADEIAAALARWQTSRSTLLRSAYDGLHQLILAAWYANPRAWPAVGYPGPPALS